MQTQLNLEVALKANLALISISFAPSSVGGMKVVSSNGSPYAGKVNRFAVCIFFKTKKK